MKKPGNSKNRTDKSLFSEWIHNVTHKTDEAISHLAHIKHTDCL